MTQASGVRSERRRAQRVGAAISTVLLAAGALALAPTALSADAAETVLYRVNAGGPAVSGWEADTKAAPSPYGNSAAAGSSTYSKSNAINLSHPSVPVGTPESIFKTERWDPISGEEMAYAFPVTAGTGVEVRLHFAEIYPTSQSVGARVFDVVIDGNVVLDNYDVYAEVGGYAAVTKSVPVTSDGSIDIEFLHVTQNTAIKGIEVVIDGPTAGTLVATPGSLAFGSKLVGSSTTQTVEVRNAGTAGAPAIVVSNVAASGSGFSTPNLASFTLQPGAARLLDVTFAPGSAGAKSGQLVVTHNGASGSTTVPLSGTGTDPAVPDSVLYRVNAGGPAVGDWEADTKAAPSPYGNSAAAGSSTYSTSNGINLSDLSVPVGTPESIFKTERWDPATGAEMAYAFPVAAGTGVEVRLHFAEIFPTSQSVGARVFDVKVDGNVVLDNYDVYAEVGGYAAVTKSVPVTSDGSIDIEFLHVTQNTAIKGIEVVVTGGGAGVLAAAPTSLAFPAIVLGDSAVQTVVLTNLGGAGDPAIRVTGATISGSGQQSFAPVSSVPFTVAPGGTASFGVRFTPQEAGPWAATLSLVHDGTPSPTTVDLTGSGVNPQTGTHFRVNAGGPSIAGSPPWDADTSGAPSSYSNVAATGSKVSSTSTQIDVSDPSIPAGTPPSIFQTERYDPAAAPEMVWSFPVADGQGVEVRLYFAETFSGAQGVGARVFDVAVDGNVVLDDYDIFADVGGYAGVMKSFFVESDGSVDIEFRHITQNPAIKAIEVLDFAPAAGQLGASPSALNAPATPPGTTSSATLQLRNLGSATDPSLTIQSVAVSGPNAGLFGHRLVGTPTLAGGQAYNLPVDFSPVTTGSFSAQLSISHTGTNSPLVVSVSGSTNSISFGKSLLSGANPQFPTSLQWGPDGRLYVATINGTINAYTIARNGPNNYAVTNTEVIGLIAQIPNRNDDGSLNSSVSGRLVTGILVTGTSSNPVVYAVSSDPRIGGGSDGEDLPLDTNSGILSRLTFTGSSWQKTDLVRGLPRSEENHTGNGLALDPDGTTLYIAYGGHTNKGAPSFNFALLPEYALSAAVLEVDLAAIGNSTYDLPTLDDEDRPGVNDANDPFGGNEGKNQARLIPGSPVDVYSPGYRNPYDLVITAAGRMFTIDNGGNAGWGGVPAGEGPGGNCTNARVDTSDTDPDSLVEITGKGFYGGHPNPTRGNKANTFNPSKPQSPVQTANPIECDYQDPGSSPTKLATFPASTNGLAEYTAGNLGGALQGDILAASFDKAIWRIEFDASGDFVGAGKLFSSVGGLPLDVTTSGATDPFPGTILVADHTSKKIVIFEPADYDGSTNTCTGANSAALDEDDDGYSNADEIASGTDPCSAGDVPPDADGDFISDLLDPDDDNDGRPDTSDPFALDPTNGAGTALPVRYDWENDGSNPGGILNLGFTGLMTNGVDNYLELFDPGKMTAGGAAGVTTIDSVTPGTAFLGTNTQEYGFQFGVDVTSTSPAFRAETSLLAPFSGVTPRRLQAMGLMVGDGTQSSYASLVATKYWGDGLTYVRLVVEHQDVVFTYTGAPLALPGPGNLELFLDVDPVASTVTASYRADGGPTVPVGSTVPVPPTWFTSSTRPAVGLISTTEGAPTFPATWGHIAVSELDPPSGSPAALIDIRKTGGLNNSTYSSGSFEVTNQSTDGSKIKSVRFDLRTAVLPDLVFDPNGTAGDTTAKPFTVDSDPGTGFLGATYSSPHDGGFDVLTLNFGNFDPGEKLTFSIDIDPTSIKGVASPGPSSSGSVSGLEMIGSTISVDYGTTTQTGRPWRFGSTLGGGHLLLRTPSPAAPSIAINGVSSPATVTSATANLQVAAAPGSEVRVLVLEAGLFTAGVPNGGFDLDPYEANSVVAVRQYTATVGPSGTVTVPVTFSKQGAESGLNHIVATSYLGGEPGPTSNVMVRKYAPGP